MICAQCSNLTAPDKPCHFCGFDPNDPNAVIALSQARELSSTWRAVRAFCCVALVAEALLLIRVFMLPGPISSFIGIPVSLFFASLCGLFAFAVANSRSSGFIGTVMFFQLLAVGVVFLALLVLSSIGFPPR